MPAATTVLIVQNVLVDSSTGLRGRRTTCRAADIPSMITPATPLDTPAIAPMALPAALRGCAVQSVAIATSDNVA